MCPGKFNRNTVIPGIRLLFILHFLFISPVLYSQIKISGPSKVCDGDLSSYQVLNSSGKTIKSYDWSFGNGNKSILPTASVLYRTPGSYTIACNVEFSDNSTETATHQVDVLGLPKAEFQSGQSSNTFCQNGKPICFNNLSTPFDSSRPLVKQVVTWGDGEIDIENGTLSQKLCHGYVLTGDFKIRFEVIDARGCKSVDYKKIIIIEGVETEILTTQDINCTSAKHCAEIKIWPSHNDFSWYLNGQSLSKNSPYCNYYSANTKLNFMAVVKNLNTLCADTLYYSDSVQFAPDNIELKKNKLHACYNDSSFQYRLENAGIPDRIEWYLNGNVVLINQQIFNLNPKIRNINPGVVVIKCMLKYSQCWREVQDTLEIKGPKARIGAWNNLQCYTNAKVFFVDSSEYLGDRISWFWKTEDKVSPGCKIWRRMEQNRYKNCIYTLDWWGKHQYPYSFSGYIDFMVFDSSSGCSDEAWRVVKIGDCGNCFKQSHYSICQGDTFLRGAASFWDPRYFSLDTGKTWIRYPGEVGKPYLGKYGVMFIIPKNFPTYAEDYGDDSFRIVTIPIVYDTVFHPDFLTVGERPEIANFQVTTTGCKTCKIIVDFQGHKFKKGEYLRIRWQNSDYKHTFQNDTIYGFVEMDSKFGGGAYLHIYYEGISGCVSHYTQYTGCGMELEMLHDTIDCPGNSHCLSLTAKDMSSDTFYSLQTGGLYYGVFWNHKWIPGQDVICENLPDTGSVSLQFICSNTSGCTDTLFQKVHIQKVVAGVTTDSKLAFCSELKQLFDSSYIVGNNGTINNYYWNFNRSNRNSKVKDPVQLFEKGGKNVVRHWVTGSHGCSDTVAFEIEIEGSKPYFVIPDTLGCAEFNARFVNLSQNCKTYIWEFGDPDNNIISVSDTQDIHFKYTKPGIYYIRLTGVDTLYSPVTGEAYHCHSDFPFDKDTVRRVRVLPYYKSDLTGPDTVCENRWFYLQSHTLTPIQHDIWKMPEGSYESRPARALVAQRKTAGVYTYTLKPDYGWISGEPYCADTPSHTVMVIGVGADFDFVSPKNDGYYYFTDKSNSSAVEHNWDFGHYNSGNNNYSKLLNPEHDFYPDTGNFKVCLVVKNILNCYDTVCKTIPQNYFESILIANVFTPENQDGKNDYYDVIISGEAKYILKIFNRYGEVVYHSETDGDRFKDQINWNGKVNNTGPACPEGTYFYQFTYSFKRNPNKVNTVSGSVNLIR